ncbi:collagen-binding domain-containing protein [Levilactobacillus andaensis]|uniref:collagen-binding domain-containing protein n=1 Tax=Levilactobacillus andaensis TaxID=2799570 RepID=UPI0019450978|nr:collagen-binding domain-containing protein [Levilactobacillus andaensis]
METKRTHFKMYKDGRKWVFACAIVLALGGATVTARADTNDSSNSSSTPATSLSSSSSGSSSESSSSSEQVASGDASQTSSSTPSTSSSSNDGQVDQNTTTDTTTSSADTTTGSDTTKNDTDAANQTSTTDKADGTSKTNDDGAAAAKHAQRMYAPAMLTRQQDTTPVETPTINTPTIDDNTAVTPDVDVANENNATDEQNLNDIFKELEDTTNVTTALEPYAESGVQAGGDVYDDFPDLNNILGVSSAFHIFARDAELNAHTNGNLAVQNLTGNVNFGTNIIEELLDKDISYIQNIVNIANSSFVSAGDTRENKVIFGEGIEIDLSNPNRPKVNGADIDHLLASEVYQDQNGQTYINFDAEFAKLKALNEQLTTATSNASYTNDDFADRNNRVIDVSDMTPDADGHIVINLSPDVLNGDTPLTISGLSPDADGNTVIINVDTGGQEDYKINSQIKLVYSDGSDRDNQETEDFGDNHLLWNFYDSTASDKQHTGTITVDRPFQGSILAPSAEVIANQNIDGNIIADKVVVNAETHRWDLQDNKDNEGDYELPNIDLPNVEEPEAPDKPNIDLPNVEEPEAPDKPNIDKPNVEEPEAPDKPNIDIPTVELPGIEPPDKPNIDKPNVEEPEAPDKPNIDLPSVELPNIEEPEKPNIDNPDVEEPEAPDKPNIDKPDVELPNTENPDTEGPDTELPNTENPDTEEPDTDVDYEHESPDEEELLSELEDEVVDFEAEQQAEDPDAATDGEAVLNRIDAAIAKAQAAHNTALVAKLQAMRAQLLKDMGLSAGLPQTGEAHQGWLQALGLLLAGGLGSTFVYRKKRQD